MEQHALVLEQVKDINLTLLNNSNSDIRNRWATKCDEVMGEKSHWNEITDTEVLSGMVLFAQELLAGPVETAQTI